MTTITIEETFAAEQIDDITPQAPEGYEVEDYDCDGLTPLVWRGPTLSGVGGSWTVKRQWAEDGHALEFAIPGTESGDTLLESDAIDLAYAILAVVIGGEPTDESDRERFREVIEYVRTRKAATE